MRAEVERLLAADDLPDTRVLDHSIDDLVSRVGEPDDEPGLGVGDTVGSFFLGEKLGEGGSSLVYRASREQDGVRQHDDSPIVVRSYSLAQSTLWRRARGQLLRRRPHAAGKPIMR